MPDPLYVGNTNLTFGHSLETMTRVAHTARTWKLCVWTEGEDDEEQMRHRHRMTIPLTVRILPRASISIERSQNTTAAVTWKVEIAGSCWRREQVGVKCSLHGPDCRIPPTDLLIDSSASSLSNSCRAFVSVVLPNCQMYFVWEKKERLTKKITRQERRSILREFPISWNFWI